MLPPVSMVTPAPLPQTVWYARDTKLGGRPSAASKPPGTGFRIPSGAPGPGEGVDGCRVVGAWLRHAGKEG